MGMYMYVQVYVGTGELCNRMEHSGDGDPSALLSDGFILVWRKLRGKGGLNLVCIRVITLALARRPAVTGTAFVCVCTCVVSRIFDIERRFRRALGAFRGCRASQDEYQDWRRPTVSIQTHI